MLWELLWIKSIFRLRTMTKIFKKMLYNRHKPWDK